MGPLGNSLYQRIGEWLSSSCLIYYIYRMTIYLYGLFLWMVARTDALVISPLLSILTVLIQVNLGWAVSLEELFPCNRPRRDISETWKFSDNWTVWGVPKKKTVSSKNREAYNLGANSTVLNRFHLKKKSLPIWSYCPPLGLIALRWVFMWVSWGASWLDGMQDNLRRR